MKTTFFVSVLSLLVLIGCAAPEVITTTEPEPAVAEFTDEDVQKLAADDRAFEEAMNGGDLDTLLSFYADDAVVLAFGGPPAKGHDEIRTVFMGLPAVKDLVLADEEQVGLGDHVYQRGTITMTVLGEDGSETPFEGDFLVTRVRDADGNWKYTNDMFTAAPVAAE